MENALAQPPTSFCSRYRDIGLASCEVAEPDDHTVGWRAGHRTG